MANPKSRDQRAERERARLYQARRELHAAAGRRRVRDNLIAAIAGGILILAVVVGQVAFYTVGPGAPVPSPSSTPAPSTTATP